MMGSSSSTEAAAAAGPSSSSSRSQRLFSRKKYDPLTVLDKSWKEDFQDEAIERVSNENDGVNGLFHKKYFSGQEFFFVAIPEEMMEIIFSYCAADDVLNLAQVCVRWKTITTSRSFWKLMCRQRSICLETIPESVKENPSAWIAYYAFCRNNILRKNFVLNHSGQDRFNDWHFEPLAHHHGAFQVEELPVGCDNLPESSDFDTYCCFVSSFNHANKAQQIDLWRTGLTPAVMMICSPFELVLTEMIGTRFDCGGMGNISLAVDRFDFYAPPRSTPIRKSQDFTFPAGNNWSTLQVEVPLSAKILKKKALRYALVSARGKDTQFWAGYYGPKFARCCVKFKFSEGVDSESVEVEEELVEEEKDQDDNLNSPEEMELDFD